MEFERLEELKKEVAESNLKVTGVGYLTDLQDLINAEIARQTVKSEEARIALNWFDELDDHEFVRRIKNEPEYLSTLPDHVVQTIITALQAYQPWVSVSERLPEIPEGGYGVMCNVMVDNCSSTKVMSLSYEKNTVRGKTVCRWKWYGRISPWNVTHWKPLPKPPKGE
jgi:hypothetical protein